MNRRIANLKRAINANRYNPDRELVAYSLLTKAQRHQARIRSLERRLRAEDKRSEWLNRIGL